MKVLLDDTWATPVVRSMAPQPKRRVRDALRLLGEDPMCRKNGLDWKQLETDVDFAVFRVRVGSWRIVYTIDEAVVVLRVFRREDGYGFVADL